MNPTVSTAKGLHTEGQRCFVSQAVAEGFSWAPKGHGCGEDISRQPEEPADSSTLERIYLPSALAQQCQATEPMAGPSEAVMVTVMAGKAGAGQEGV